MAATITFGVSCCSLQKKLLCRIAGLNASFEPEANKIFLKKQVDTAFTGDSGILFQVSVGGFMYFWGLTIDSTSCIALQLATGLCVDYAAHICLAFLSRTGSRAVRALEAMTNIGPAVYNGGISSLLAISMLALSESYVFTSFFKVKYVMT